jgi:hypothetical protein
MNSTAAAGAAMARATGRPTSLAAVLVPYACAHGWDGPALAQQLGCSLPVLPRLLLCLPPRPEQFGRDVAKIAAYVGIDAVRLTDLLRATAQG